MKSIAIKLFYLLIAIFSIVSVFLLVTILVRKGEALLPPQASGDFPVSPLSGALPSQPEFIGISGYYFSAPSAIKSANIISGPAFFASLCLTGEKYDIIQVGSVTKGNKLQLLTLGDYKCWLKSCQNNADNIFVSVFSFSPQAYEASLLRGKAGAFEKMGANLSDKMASPCLEN